ncbi:hypothetical protein GCM10022222_78810 [Amycolatopsis ultiminotia]|uniref:HTH tetR-type domain-containing protein n=1 Tax=Amycolatopsis ultiminotia TaxID=543629 RepID=A0ABP6YEN0_9PSEU
MEKTTPPTLWDRSRLIAVQTILDVAVRLFLEQGYEQTTIAQITREAGISPRSLFRYFGSKEDLVCGEQEALGELLRATVSGQRGEVSAWEALRAGFLAIMTANHSLERTYELTTLIFTTPSLHASYLTKRLRWQKDLLPCIQSRMGLAEDEHDPRASAIIATAFACLDTATEIWIAGNRKADPVALYDRCVAAVRDADPPTV